MPDNTLRCPKRLLHLDLLRIIAIFFVIFNHTSSRGYLLFADRMDSVLYFPYMAVSVLCKVAVPIFFMISGALLLPKQESYKDLFTKRVLRMAVVLLLISVPYYIWLHRSQGLSLSCFLTYIYGDSASTSLWYLYSYIALLLMLPFLRSMIRGMKEKDFLYLIAGYILVMGVVPCLEFCLWQGHVTIHESFSPILFMVPNIFFALIGYYLEHVLDFRKNRTRRILIGITFSVVAVALTCVMTDYWMRTTSKHSTEQLERFFDCFICIPAMSVYCIMKCAGEKICSAKMQKLLPLLGGATFGIYLTEKFSRAITDTIYTLTTPFLGSFAASVLWAFSSLIVSLLVILLSKNIPVVKKIVNKFI